MTALAGFWDFGDGRARDACARMLKAQQMYGPHDGAQTGDGAMAMGRQLYRLLPEDIHDRGPVTSANGRLTLIADVRLDNRDELSAELGLAADLTDAAVLLAALEHWDEGALDRIVGDFAFALWDAAAQKLLLARDFIGQRPLHYHRGDGFFAFASMPRGLHALPEVPYGPSEVAAADFLVLVPESGAESFFEGVARVPPAHLVTVTKDGVASRRYWDPPRRMLRLPDADAYAEAMREQMDMAVRARLRRTGAIGSHLSAGLDSATVAATAARMLGPDARLTAFTAIPAEGHETALNGRLGDEGPLAQATAAMHPAIEHVRVGTGGTSPLRNLDRNFYLYERPMLNLCNGNWMEAINDAAKARGIGVLLTGQMGNMSFSHTGLEHLAQLLRRGRLIALLRTGRALRRRGMRWSGVAALSLGPYLPGPIWSWLNRKFGDGQGSLSEYSAISLPALADMGVERRAAERGVDPNYRPWADGLKMRRWVLERVDLGNSHKGVLAGWGIDMRDPTADRRLVEFCLSVPAEAFLRDGEPRGLARQAFADRLPAAVLQERRKGYQAADWYIGLAAARAEIEDELERFKRCAPASAMVDIARLERMLADWPKDGWQRPEVMQSYRLAMLRGISAGHFLRKASRSN